MDDCSWPDGEKATFIPLEAEYLKARHVDQRVQNVIEIFTQSSNAESPRQDQISELKLDFVYLRISNVVGYGSK